MRIVDSHIHIWPQSHLDTLAWQSPSNPLYSQHSINEYLSNLDILPTDDHKGFIFIEADRKFSLHPFDYSQPINEFKYALSIHRREQGEGYTIKNASKLLAMIAWAPIPLGADAMTAYTNELLALCSSEKEYRSLLKGFRYLIQDKDDGTCLQDKFIEAIRWCGENGYKFELGIDFQNRGRRHLEEALKMVQKCPETSFIIGIFSVRRG